MTNRFMFDQKRSILYLFFPLVLSNCIIFQVNLEKPFINRRGREVEVVIEGEKNGQTYVSFFSEDGRKKGYTFVDKNQITYKKVFSKKKVVLRPLFVIRLIPSFFGRNDNV